MPKYVVNGERNLSLNVFGKPYYAGQEVEIEDDEERKRLLDYGSIVEVAKEPTPAPIPSKKPNPPPAAPAKSKASTLSFAEEDEK